MCFSCTKCVFSFTKCVLAVLRPPYPANRRPILPTAALSCQPPPYPSNRRLILPTAALSCQPPHYPANRQVADFGLTQKKQLGAAGTPFWMAPELLSGSPITPCRLPCLIRGLDCLRLSYTEDCLIHGLDCLRLSYTTVLYRSSWARRAPLSGCPWSCSAVPRERVCVCVCVCVRENVCVCATVRDQVGGRELLEGSRGPCP